MKGAVAAGSAEPLEDNPTLSTQSSASDSPSVTLDWTSLSAGGTWGVGGGTEAGSGSEKKGVLASSSLVLMLMLSIFLCYADRIIMPSCIKSISEEFGFSKSDQGFILGLFYGGYIWTQILGGYVSDSSRLGGKGVLFLGVLFWSVCMVFTSFLSYFGILGFIICRIALGVGEGVSFPALNSIVGQYIPPRYSSTVISVIIASSYMGGGFAAFVTPPMIQSLGWRGPFYVFGLVGVAWSLVWLFLDVRSLSWTSRPRLHEFRRHQPLGADPSGPKDLRLCPGQRGSGGPEEPRRMLGRGGVRETLRFAGSLLGNKSIYAIISSQYCHGWTQFGFVTWMPVYFSDVCKVGAASLGYFTTPPWVLQAFFIIFFGHLADRLVSSSALRPVVVRKLFQSVSMFVGAGCQLGLVLLNQLGLNFPSYAVLVISVMFIFNTVSAGGVTVYQFDIAPEFPGVVYAIGNTFGTVAGLFSVSLTGLILNRSEVDLQAVEQELEGSAILQRWKWVLTIYAVHNIIGGLAFVFLADDRQIVLEKSPRAPARRLEPELGEEPRVGEEPGKEARERPRGGSPRKGPGELGAEDKENWGVRSGG
ncbi:ascorbate transporter, chloroplastic [Cryptosporidium felis]|nr:ascorbate transporter, chloroplastic [Cryptosporidium felis]